MFHKHRFQPDPANITGLVNQVLSHQITNHSKGTKRDGYGSGTYENGVFLNAIWS